MTPKLIADDREFEITADVWNALKGAAQPFEMPNDVLRRVLLPTGDPNGTSKSASPTTKTAAKARSNRQSAKRRPRGQRARSTKRTRVASDQLLPDSEYELPILKAIADAGGRRPTREVLDVVGDVLKDRFTELDGQPIRDGGPPRWQNRTQFVRLRLVKEGLMKEDSPRGVWEISPQGMQRLTKAG